MKTPLIKRKSDLFHIEHTWSDKRLIMRFDKIKNFESHGKGQFKRSQFKKIGSNVIFEKNVLVFHPENIEIGNNIYVGHNTILKVYHKNKLIFKYLFLFRPLSAIYCASYCYQCSLSFLQS